MPRLSLSACSRRLPSRWWNWVCRCRAFVQRSTLSRAWSISEKPWPATGGAMTISATVEKTESVPIANSSDVVVVRQRVRAWAIELKFSLVDQTKIVTAASELGRNTLEHGGGGGMEMALVVNG